MVHCTISRKKLVRDFYLQFEVHEKHFVTPNRFFKDTPGKVFLFRFCYILGKPFYCMNA